MKPVATSSVQGASSGPASVDDLMDRASEALVRCAYFEAETLALKGLRRGFEARDYERMARICLPLQEARRQKMQLAQDARRVVVVDAALAAGGITAPGMYLVQPPMIAAEARELRLAADRRRVCTIVLAREPMSRSGARTGLWPIVAVGPSLSGRDISVRAYVSPPAGVAPAENGMTRDTMAAPPSPAWMLGACEALGDAAIDKLNPADPAAHRVEDLLEFLDVWPLHEKLHQRLMHECRLALTQPAPEGERRRGVAENPWSF